MDILSTIFTALLNGLGVALGSFIANKSIIKRLEQLKKKIRGKK